MVKRTPQETSMEVTSEVKAVAKSVGAHLRKTGHTVPHSVLLHALAGALAKRNWHVLKAAASQAGSGPVEKAEAASAKVLVQRPGPCVRAFFRTDDRRYEVEFDAQAYLSTLPRNRLEAIYHVGFEGDTCTDDAAEAMIGTHPEIAEAFQYLDALNQRRGVDSLGFECRISETDYYAWMDQHRKPVLAKLLGVENGVSVEASLVEPDKWFWHNDDSSELCESEEDAYLLAYSQLGLLAQAIAEAQED